MIAAMIPLALGLQRSPIHEATTPTSRLKELWWSNRHDEKLLLSQQPYRLVFLGDSITQRWETVSPSTWNAWNAANFGYNGDRTQHALWRLYNGEVIGCQPDVIVIFIGTNNLGHGPGSPQKAADGVRMLGLTLLMRLPRANLLILPPIPRGTLPADAIRAESNELAEKIALMVGSKIHTVDIAPLFLETNGTLRADRLMPDMVHPNEEGYDQLQTALQPKIEELLGG